MESESITSKEHSVYTLAHIRRDYLLFCSAGAALGLLVQWAQFPHGWYLLSRRLGWLPWSISLLPLLLLSPGAAGSIADFFGAAAASLLATLLQWFGTSDVCREQVPSYQQEKCTA